MKHLQHVDIEIGVHKESNCHKDYVSQLSPAETVCYVNESIGKTLICDKARSRQIFLAILRNIQFASRQVLAF